MKKILLRSLYTVFKTHKKLNYKNDLRNCHILAATWLCWVNLLCSERFDFVFWSVLLFVNLYVFIYVYLRCEDNKPDRPIRLRTDARCPTVVTVGPASVVVSQNLGIYSLHRNLRGISDNATRSRAFIRAPYLFSRL